MILFSRMMLNIVAIHLPVAIVCNLIFYFIYLCTKVNCWVDFGWVFNQFAIAGILFFTGNFNLETIIPFSVITIWAIRLGKVLIFQYN